MITRYKPSLAEFIKNKEEGILVETDNSEAMAKALKELLQDRSLHNRISNTAKEKVKNFYADKIVKQYEEFFINLANL